MVKLSCFRPAKANAVTVQDEPPRVVRRKANVKRTSTDKSTSSRTSTASASSSISTNSSISQLPPCKRMSDLKVESMMMPLPEEQRQSRCLRLSQPRIYSNIVDSMKQQRGCRNWKEFNVFYNDEIDMSISADDIARRRAADYERKLRMLSSFSDDEARLSIGVDLIG